MQRPAAPSRGFRSAHPTAPLARSTNSEPWTVELYKLQSGSLHLMPLTGSASRKILRKRGVGKNVPLQTAKSAKVHSGSFGAEKKVVEGSGFFAKEAPRRIAFLFPRVGRGSLFLKSCSLAQAETAATGQKTIYVGWPSKTQK